MRPETGRLLRLIAGGMGAGVVALAAAAVFMHLRAEGRVPTPSELRTANALTTAAMAAALAAIVGAQLAWKAAMAGSGDLDARLRKAFILRTALREAGALPGCVAALLAAGWGVMRVYPAYWALLVPAGLFFSYLAAHWPSDERLAEDARLGL